MKRTGGVAQRKQWLSVLSEAQLEGIHAASLEVLAQTGCIVPLAEARDLLAAAGARWRASGSTSRRKRWSER